MANKENSCYNCKFSQSSGWVFVCSNNDRDSSIKTQRGENTKQKNILVESPLNTICSKWKKGSTAGKIKMIKFDITAEMDGYKTSMNNDKLTKINGAAEPKDDGVFLCEYPIKNQESNLTKQCKNKTEMFSHEQGLHLCQEHTNQPERE